MDKSEHLGLGAAVIGHVALFGALSLGIAARTEIALPTEPISVQIADEVGLESTAPNPTRDAATAAAPEIGDMQKPVESASTPALEPAKPAPAPPERAAPRPSPAPKPARSSPPPPPKPQSRAPDRPAKSEPKREARAPRLGSDFLDGVTDRASTSKSQASPAAKAGPAVVASLQRELYRQVKPHWNPPTGADSEKLRTKVMVRLDDKGNIVGTPSATTTGVTASNRAQERLHQERAIKAVQLAAPFDFPPQYYDEWQTIEPVFYLGL